MRLFRSLKSRFILLFVIFIIALCASLSGIAISQTIRVASDIFAAEGRMVVDNAVSLIDGDSFAVLVQSLDKTDPFYEAARRRLLDLKQLSRCRYLYSMAPAGGNTWRFIIDGSAPPEDTEAFSPLGAEEDVSEYDDAFFKVWETKQTSHSRIEYLEPYGWILSIYAPIWNSAGEAVGVVGCDFGAEELFNTIRVNAIAQIVVSLIAMAIGLMLVLVFLQAIFNRFNKINAGLDAMLGQLTAGEEDLARWIRVRCGEGEMQDLSHFFAVSIAKIRTLVQSTRKHTLNVFSTGTKASGGDRGAQP